MCISLQNTVCRVHLSAHRKADKRRRGRRLRTRGAAAMITRSKLVEQLRDYQIRSQHKRDIIGAVSWGILLCFLIISSYLAIYFRHFKLSAAIIFLGIVIPSFLHISRQRKLAKKRERRLLLPLSM